MPEFLTLLPPLDSLEIFLKNFKSNALVEVIKSEISFGRVLAEPVIAKEQLPAFRRSTVDGYAVQAKDTYGASGAIPAYLGLVGESQMGQRPERLIEPTKAMTIHTGGMLPEGADSVMMIEHTQQIGQNQIEVYKAVSVGENVLQVGEDVASEEQVIPAGRVVRSAEIGGLMALGILNIPAVSRPKVGIISSGDEIIPPNEIPKAGQVRDINSFTLATLVNESGGNAIRYGVAGDSLESLSAMAEKALVETDMLVITAGSSASVRDLTAQVIDNLGEPGVLVHGVNLKPGKPTILAVCNGKPIVGLPGNPVSALVVARIFVVAAIDQLLKKSKTNFPAMINAKVNLNLSSQAGREDWVAVEVTSNKEGWIADPLFGKSNLIFTLVRANGLLKIPAPVTGYAAGEMVEVFRF